jgi:diguanylate cyclase (GGDEF)-like protein
MALGDRTAMQEILALAVELDTAAYKTYSDLSAACANDPDLARTFSLMAKEEQQHVGWWSDLLEAWEAGLLPDIADEHDLLARLREIKAEVIDALPESLDTLSTAEMLDLAAHLEFYMLDPVFGELTDLMRPGGRIEVREAYSRHVLRIVETIERRHPEKGLASFLARVLTRAYRDQQRLASLAMRDQLTGLYNRRGLLSHLNQWLSWSQRYNHPVGIVLIDIDRFKSINDNWGHPAGDQALRAVAESIESATRASDIVGRFGGDEFLILAPESDEIELVALMERVVLAVRGNTLHVSGHDLAATVSVGGSCAPGGVSVTSEALIAAADRSMYEAKATGRDRAGVPLPVGPLCAE